MGKGSTLLILNEDTNDIIKIIKLEDLDVLTDGVTEAVKHEIKKKQEGRVLVAFLAPLTASVVQPVISSVVKDKSGKEVR